MRTMRLLLFGFLPLVILGCQSSAKIAAAATERAKPHADTTGKEFLDAAHDEHWKADAKLVDAQAALIQVRADEAAKAAEVVRQKALLEVYHDRWTGDKFQRLLVRVIAGLATAIGIALVAFAVAPRLGGLLGSLTGGLGHVGLDHRHGGRERH